MLTWVHIRHDGDLVIDWEEVRINSDMYDRGHRNMEAEMGKMLSAIQRECYEKGFKDGLRNQDSARLWSGLVKGEA